MRQSGLIFNLSVLFLFASLCFIYSTKIARGGVSSPEFQSFVEGDPGIPGDGIFVSPGVDALFELDPPFSLTGVSDGITITVFPSESDIPDFEAPMIFGIIISSGGAPCSAPEFTLIPPNQFTFNGSTGFAFLYIQETFEIAVNNISTSSPECSDNVDDYVITDITFRESFAIPLFPDLDALAIGFGQNNIPEDTKQFFKSFETLLRIFGPLPFIIPPPEELQKAIDALELAISISLQLPGVIDQIQIEIGIDKIGMFLSAIRPGGFFLNPDCVIETPEGNCLAISNLRIIEVENSPTSIFELFDFDISVIVEKPNEELFEIGDKFVTSLPFLGFEPSFSIVEVTNVIDPPEFGIIDFRVEGIALLRSPSPIIIIPSYNQWGRIIIVGVLGLFGIICLLVMKRRSVVKND